MTREEVELRAPRFVVWDVVAGHVVPAAVFALLLTKQVTRAREAVVAAIGHGASPTSLLRAGDAALTVVYLALLAGLYLFRLPSRGGDRRPGIVAASFVGTFVVMCVPYLPAAGVRDGLLLPADIASLLGIGIAVWSLAYLRRSFAILPQARRLVTGGPYGTSRNPLYVGEVLGAWSVYLPTMAWPALLVLVGNVVLQLVRVRAEERVLAAAFGDEYEAYRGRVARFLPNPFRVRLTPRRSRRQPAVPAP